MIAPILQVRPAVASDQRRLADLIAYESHVHKHLDWRVPIDWLGSPNFWLMEVQDRLLAALACPQDPPGIAWVRLFVHSALIDALEAWSVLWGTARDQIAAALLNSGPAAGVTVAAIALKPWFQDLLPPSGFKLHQHILLLEWERTAAWVQRDLQPAAPLSDIHIRLMKADDLAEVAAVDADAFDLLWRNSQETLGRALSQALYASVAEQGGRLIGYQLSTGNAFGAHLGRLAVRRAAQGNGLGEALLSDLQGWLSVRGLLRLTVNTQADNAASLRLYQKAGFMRTGEVYPVFIREIRE